MFEHFTAGILSISNLSTIFIIASGVALGIFAGAIPGLSASIAVALAVPFTYAMSPTLGLALLCAIYTAAEYGGSISAITLNAPGTASAAITALDGYPMAQQGKPGKALGFAITASTFGGIFSTIVLIFLSVPLAAFALTLGAPEYFAVGVLGLTVVSSMAGEKWLKAFITTLFGLFIVCIGLDNFSGLERFTFGVHELEEGIPLLPALVGLFAISTVFLEMTKLTSADKKSEFGVFSGALPSLKETLGKFCIMLRSACIGIVVGILPGAGATISSIISYSETKRFSNSPETFGKGNPDGVCASEAANNGSVGGALVPLLALGIPGSPTAAIMIGAFMLHGITPGPWLFDENPTLVYGVFASLFLANIFMFLIGIGATKFWVKVVAISPKYLYPLVLGMCLTGCYAVTNSMYGVWLGIIFGVIGCVIQYFDFDVTPTVLAIVLGGFIENSFRRSLVMSQNDYSIFVSSPVCIAVLGLGLFSFVWPFIRRWRQRKALAAQNA